MTTRAEQKHMDKVASMGCVICGNPAELHHPRFASGMSQRSSNWLVIGLCPYHHRQGGYSESIHLGQQEFEKKYGSEAELLAQTIEKVTK